MKRTRLLAATALLASIILFTARPAAASNGGSTSCGGAPRNCISLSWYSAGQYRMYITASVGTNMVTELIWQMQNTYTSAATHLEMSRTFNAGSYEVWVQTYNLPSTGTLAWVECQVGSVTSGSHPNLRCGYQNMYLNSALGLDWGSGDPNYLAAIACHEMGHTVGLRHSSDTNSCLRNPATASFWSLTSHDRSHLVGYYS